MSKNTNRSALDKEIDELVMKVARLSRDGAEEWAIDEARQDRAMLLALRDVIKRATMVGGLTPDRYTRLAARVRTMAVKDTV